MSRIIAAYGGGFKPPTAGHFEIVDTALEKYPEIDEFIIYVGSKERDGIEQFESIQVWEIYKKYLANKVDIQPAKAPMKDILNLAKENPQDMIYFILGFRDGRDDDMKDVAARTSNLEEKYPNIKVITMSTTDANMSGTNARKAIGNEEEFIKFLPSEVKEKSQIWNLVRPVVTEKIVGDKIECDNCGWSWKIVDGGNDLYICHKCDYDNTPRLNENATYSQNIDYMQMISDLTNHMVEQGRNIEPLPKLKIEDGDSENAKDFFGKTAYYDPNTQTIVLYTEGRHPKDIVRSFAHEMVHHTQNLEGRIGNIQTTDTTEDEDLDAIEREAYLNGNMIFRNWTDSIDGDVSSSINERKDHFGLNQLIREIVEEPKYKIFSDMDGVLTDFDASFKKASDGVAPRDYEKKFGKDKFWELIDGGGVGYWVGMPYMPDGETYWNYIKDYDVELLSSPSRSNTSRLGKRLWVRNNMPGVKLTLAQAYLKKNYAAPNHILIDDRESNIDQWRAAGGIGILHTSASDTIRQLKKLGL